MAKKRKPGGSGSRQAASAAGVTAKAVASPDGRGASAVAGTKSVAAPVAVSAGGKKSAAAAAADPWQSAQTVWAIVLVCIALEGLHFAMIKTGWVEEILPGLAGIGWARNALWAVSAVALGIFGRRSRKLVLAAAFGGALATFGLVFALWLSGIVVVTWGIAKLPLPRWLRLSLCVGAVLAPMLAGYYASLGNPPVLTFTVFQAVTISGLLMRVLIYQAETGELAQKDRGIVPYAGVLGMNTALGITWAPAVPWPQIFPQVDKRPWARVAADGTLLVGLALVYGVITVILKPYVLPGLPAAASQGHLNEYLLARGRMQLFFDLFLPMVAAYFRAAGAVFLFTGHLRILGCDVRSGYLRPFLSVDFGDFWRRWDYFYRDAALKLFFFPIMARARRWGSMAFSSALAVAGALIGLLFFRRVVEPAAAHGFASLTTRVATPHIARGVAVGVLTVLTVYVLTKWPRRGKMPWYAQAPRIMITVGLIGFFFALMFMGLFGLSTAQIETYLAFVFFGTTPV